MDIESMLYLMKPNIDTMWEYKQELILHEQRCGNYSFIVIENKKKNIRQNECFEELKPDLPVRE
jgi:hypothetical protein